MNAISETLKDVIVAAGVGQFGGSADWAIYIGDEPPTPDNVISLFDYSTEDVADTDLADGSRAVDRMRVQVRIRALAQMDAHAKFQQIQTVLQSTSPFGNVEGADAVRYVKFIPLESGPMPIGRDDRQRFMFTRNYRCNRWVVGSATATGT